jgi:hypothetical protein
MRFAYADPPYPGQALKHYGTHPDYGGEVNHRELVDRLVAEYPDGWALSTGAKWLRNVLLLCPPEVRVMAWVKTMAPPFSLRVQYSWEPVILYGGRPYEGGPRTVRDSLVCHPQERQFKPLENGDVIGRKPTQFCRWIFEALGAEPGDTLSDLFPGSGVVGREWARFTAQTSLFAGQNATAPHPKARR